MRYSQKVVLHIFNQQSDVEAAEYWARMVALGYSTDQLVFMDESAFKSGEWQRRYVRTRV